MSRETDIKRLKKSLHETQDILNDLISETRAELEKKWDTSRTDASKRLMEASKRFEKNYDRARVQLDSAIKGTSKELEKQYAASKKDAEKMAAKTSKDAEKLYDKTRHDAIKGYSDIRKEAKTRLEEAKTNLNARTEDLKFRTADFLQGLAAGLISMRNKLEPKERLALRNEKEKHHLGKGGYFKRFIALALIIVSKKDQILSLGQQLYHKLQDKGARDAIKDEAREQYDTMRRLMKAYANGEYKEFPYMSIVKIVAAVVYFVSVVDLIPDFIPILGLTDDLAILAWVYASVKDDLQNFVDWEAANERRQEKMENQKNTSTTTSKSTTPAPDREASPNAGAATRSTTQPSVTSSTIGASSSAINSKAFEGSNKGTDKNASTNTGSSGSSAASSTTGAGSENKNSGSTGNSGTGSSAASSSNSNKGGTSSGSSGQGDSNQKSGGSSSSTSSGGKSNK